jgi:hypothetical protein
VQNAVLLITLAQFAMWTDAQGVVHVAATTEAPRGATAIEGGSYSVIDGDGRPLVMPDGGARADDAAWWRARFEEARRSLQASVALESAATRDLHAASEQVCATATAKATARVQLPARRQRGPLVVEDHAESTVRNCQRAQPAASLVLAVEARRSERHKAEQALRQLEQEALAEHVPLREWR